MSKSGAFFLTIATAALLAGCANGPNDASALSIAPAAGPTAGPTPAAVVSETEPEIDCKKLTGRMQIRILEMRTFATTAQTTGLSRTMHAAGKTVFGGTSAGLDPKGTHARDYVTLESYNRQLVAQDCKSFDLQQTLAGQDTPPQPTVAPPSKQKAAVKKAP